MFHREKTINIFLIIHLFFYTVLSFLYFYLSAAVLSIECSDPDLLLAEFLGSNVDSGILSKDISE